MARSLEIVRKHAENNVVIGKTFRSERRRLFDFIRSRVRTEEDAEDILQDVFYQMAASYSVTEPIEKLVSWLFTVTRNKIIDRYRKKRTTSVSLLPPAGAEDDNDAQAFFSLEDFLFDPAEIPDEVYARTLIWSELMSALDDLPEEQRDVFVMHELEGRSFKEIAEITGEPVSTLLSRKRYAILFLRERLQDLYTEMKNN
jgi:RNA polymerase sigma factor (sigma-70 family)